MSKGKFCGLSVDKTCVKKIPWHKQRRLIWRSHHLINIYYVLYCILWVGQDITKGRQRNTHLDWHSDIPLLLLCIYDINEMGGNIRASNEGENRPLRCPYRIMTWLKWSLKRNEKHHLGYTHSCQASSLHSSHIARVDSSRYFVLIWNVPFITATSLSVHSDACDKMITLHWLVTCDEWNWLSSIGWANESPPTITKLNGTAGVQRASSPSEC